MYVNVTIITTIIYTLNKKKKNWISVIFIHYRYFNNVVSMSSYRYLSKNVNSHNILVPVHSFVSIFGISRIREAMKRNRNVTRLSKVHGNAGTVSHSRANSQSTNARVPRCRQTWIPPMRVHRALDKT